MNNSIRHVVIENYGPLSGWNGDTEFRLVNWNGQVKYDLRKWGDDDKPYKGITINKEELPFFIKLVDEALLSDKAETPIHTLNILDKTIQVFNNFGSFGNSGQYRKYITYTKWFKESKYDIRLWREDFSKCSSGVALTEESMKQLSRIIHEKIKPDNKTNKGSIDTSEIDDLLI